MRAEVKIFIIEKMTNLTSDEINYLIYRYLAESGFSHSSFSFANESGILKSDIKGSLVGPGTLIRILQKGLLYMSLEAHVSPDGNIVKCLAPFTLLGPHECQVYPLNDTIPDQNQESSDVHDIALNNPQEHTLAPMVAPVQHNNNTEKEHIEKDYTENVDMEMDSPAIVQEKTDWISYHGHTSEVFTCAWNKNDEWIATGYFVLNKSLVQEMVQLEYGQ